MARSKNVKRKKKSILQFLKLMTKWLSSKNRGRDQLEYMINHYNMDISVVYKRLLSYHYGCPSIIVYCNKYMNSKFDFSKYDIFDLIYSFCYVQDSNGRSTSRDFYYLSSSEMRNIYKNKIINVLDQYFKIVYDIRFSKKELNFYYKLFEINMITPEQIIKCDKLLNNNKSSLKLDNISSAQLEVNESNNINVIKHNREENKINILSTDRKPAEKIQNYIEEIKNTKINREQCKQCKLYNNGMVVLDTNIEDIGEVDVVFIGLNPGKTEFEIGLPFIGKTGLALRENISKHFNSNIKWLITNSILCWTNNQTEIGNVKNIQNNCSELFYDIMTNFPSKLYVPIGGPAVELFNKFISGSITKIAGKRYDFDGFTIIPLVHPSYSFRVSGGSHIFDRQFLEVVKYFTNASNQQINNIKQQQQTISTNSKINMRFLEGKIIENISDNYTLFDVREIDNNKIIKIFIDENGKKLYKIEENNSIQFKIKRANPLKCKVLEDKFSTTVVINGGYEKYKISSKLRESLRAQFNV